MGEFDSPKRPLRFPYRNPIGPIEITTEDALYSASSLVWPEDNDEKTDVVMHISLNEYVVLSSTLDVGSDIAYGKDAFRVMWLWMTRNYTLTEICAQIIDCINDDEDVQDKIVSTVEESQDFKDFLSEYIMEHPSGSTYNKNLPIPETTKITTNNDCDLDILWAQCRGIVETSNTFVVDFIEKWETYTNKGEVVSDMLNAVPFLSEAVQASGAAGVIEYANDLVDAIGENYLADYDETYEINLSCELFCAAQLHGDCRLTIKDILDIMVSRTSSALNLGNVTELIVSLTDQDITGINVADLYLCFFFAALQIGNIVLPVEYGFETFIGIISVINEPNDDWVGLCETCPIEECLDFATGTYEWGVYLGIGEYVEGVGFEAILAGDYYLYTATSPTGTREGTVSQVKMIFNQPVTNVTFQAVGPGDYMVYDGDPAAEIIFNIHTFPSLWHDFDYDVTMYQTSLNAGGMSEGATLIGICFMLTL